MSANVALVCIFSPKLWIILFEKHKNVRKQDGDYMLQKRLFYILQLLIFKKSVL